MCFWDPVYRAGVVSRSTKPEIFMSLSYSVLSQSGPPKSVGSGGGSGEGGSGGGSGEGGSGGGSGEGGSGVVYHTSTGQYTGVETFFFFFFFFKPGVKLDEKSTENGLEGQKFLVMCLFWGGCHHPNIIFGKGSIATNFKKRCPVA